MNTFPFSARRLLMLLVAVLVAAPSARAQSLDERLEERRFLRGLVELELPRVLEHYIATHPAGDDEVRAAHYEIARALLDARARRLDSPERLEAVERALAARRALVDDHPPHPRRALWLADQAADLYFEVLPHRAAVLTVLFGVPDEEQRRIVIDAAREMESCGARAEIEIEQTLLEIEASPGYREDETLQMRRRRLSRDERERRIPFLHGVGLCLRGRLEPQGDAERGRRLDLARALLEPLARDLDGTLAAQARFYAGLAAAGAGALEESDEQYRAAVEVDGATDVDVLAARLGLVENGAARGVTAGLAVLRTVSGHYGTDAPLLYRLLLADVRFRLLRERAAVQTGPEAQATRRDAFASYLRLADDAPPARRPAVRQIVFDRLVLVSGRAASLDELPPIVSVARAEHEIADAATRGQGIVRLETVLEREDADEAERAGALFVLGRALLAEGRDLEAVARFLSLAEQYPRQPEAERAIVRAASVARRSHRDDPRDEEARVTLRRALDVLLERYPGLPTIDRWRYAAGRLALEENRPADAAQLFQAVAPDVPEWMDAQFMHVNALRELAQQATERGPRADANAAVIAAAEQAERELSGAAPSGRSADQAYYVAYLRVFRAEALLATGRAHDAVEALAGIETQSHLESRVRAAALRVRIDAYQALQRPEAARADIERFLEAAPEQAGYVIDSMLASMLAELEVLLDASREEEARQRASRDLEPLAVLLEEWIEQRGTTVEAATREALQRRVADVHRASGRYADALRHYDVLARGRGDAVEILLGRAECLYGLGGEGYAEAMRLYRRLAAGVEEGSGAWWLSHLRMLQILDVVGRNTDKILPQINQLRARDEQLGGERYRRAFQVLLRKYGG